MRGGLAGEGRPPADEGCFWGGYPDPQKNLKIRSPRTIGEIIKLYKDYIGVIFFFWGMGGGLV